MKKPEVGDYYRASSLRVLKIISVNKFLNEATYTWTTSEEAHIWDYKGFPEILKNKLTSLEIELL